MASLIRRAAALLFAAVIVAALWAPGAALGKKKSSTHKPPYKKGPSGGDHFNHIESDPKTGTMWIGRLFPGFSPVVGCEPEPSGGWATFHVPHSASGRVKKILFKYDEARLDPYAWITVAAFKGPKKDKNWLGTKKLQGPVAEKSGSMKLRLVKRVGAGDKITLEFGLQLGDSCPQAGYAHVTFPRIKVL